MTLAPVELIGRAKGDATDGAIPPSSRGGRALLTMVPHSESGWKNRKVRDHFESQ